MKKNRFAVIGHPIVHTISPFIHKRLFEMAKVDAEYQILDIKSENLEHSMNILRSLDGYNVTIPHKFGIIKFLDKISQKSEIYNSVNTVKNTDISVGYTTDAGGFVRAMEYEKLKIGGRVVVVGAGGVASVMAHELALKDCSVTIAIRNSGLEKAEKLAESLKINVPNSNVDVCSIQDISEEIDLLVNATPVGMYPQKSETVVGNEVLANCKQVYDAVYNPCETQLIKQAKSFGIKAVSGLSMLVFQAVLAHKIWVGSEYDDDQVYQLIYDCFDEIDKKFN